MSRKTAVFTLVQNEMFLLDKWIGHYCAAGFSTRDIYVLDHESSGDARSQLFQMQHETDVRVISVKHAFSYDETWMREIVGRFQSFLLSSYDVVVFAAADEFLVSIHDNEPDDLYPYLQEFNAPTMRATGLDVIQTDGDLAITNLDHVMSRRHACCQSRRASKLCVARTPANPLLPDLAELCLPNPELLLLHLHRIDAATCLRQHRERAARQWRPHAPRDGYYRHNLIEDPEMLKRWLRCDPDDTSKYADLQEIPVLAKLLL